jgi:toxin ParE1/3/4
VANDVAFHPLAFSDLEALDDFIARDSPERAASFVGRIRQFCESLAEFPERGRLREDFGAGIRTLSFERRIVVAYRLERRTVVVLRVFYAGQDYGPESF